MVYMGSFDEKSPFVLYLCLGVRENLKSGYFLMNFFLKLELKKIKLEMLGNICPHWPKSS